MIGTDRVSLFLIDAGVDIAKPTTPYLITFTYIALGAHPGTGSSQGIRDPGHVLCPHDWSSVGLGGRSPGSIRAG